MFSFRKRDRYKAADKSDFRGGRAFDPLDVADGRARLVITIDGATQHADGTYPVHLDYFNMPLELRQRNANEMLMIAQRIVTSDGAAHAREEGYDEAARDYA